MRKATTHLKGGPGGDKYYLDSPFPSYQAHIDELPDEGFDMVFTKRAAYTLPANVEFLEFEDDSPHTGIGNEGDNYLDGGAGGLAVWPGRRRRAYWFRRRRLAGGRYGR